MVGLGLGGYYHWTFSILYCRKFVTSTVTNKLATLFPNRLFSMFLLPDYTRCDRVRYMGGQGWLVGLDFPEVIVWYWHRMFWHCPLDHTGRETNFNMFDSIINNIENSHRSWHVFFFIYIIFSILLKLNDNSPRIIIF